MRRVDIGFTGTRHGMTEPQRRALDITISDIIGGDTKLQVVAHHGDCVGADEGFHVLARMYGCAVCVHPPVDTTHAVNTKESVSFDGSKVVRRKPDLYMARNKAIVDESDVMIACPQESTEQQRGGTWATVRMARRAGKPLALVLPDGTVNRERWPE